MINIVERFITPNNLITARFKSDKERPKWDAAIISFRDHKGSTALVKHFNATPVGYKTIYGLEESEEMPHVFEAKIANLKVGIIARCIWGGPQAAILVEELSELGVKTIIGFGAAGSIDSRYQQGTQIVIEKALITDGTSVHYTNEVAEPDTGLMNSLDATVMRVHAATTDALFRETPELINKWLINGAQIINMEAAPFYAASKACNVKCIWIGHVSDTLLGKWADWHVDRTEMTMGSILNCVKIFSTLTKD